MITYMLMESKEKPSAWPPLFLVNSSFSSYNVSYIIGREHLPLCRMGLPLSSIFHTQHKERSCGFLGFTTSPALGILSPSHINWGQIFQVEKKIIKYRTWEIIQIVHKLMRIPPALIHDIYNTVNSVLHIFMHLTDV
jgi:hypothetical protein